MPKQPSRPLTSVERQGVFVVDSVSDQDAALLKKLKDYGITPGVRIHVSTSSDEFALRAESTKKTLHLPRVNAGAVRIRIDRAEARS